MIADTVTPAAATLSVPPGFAPPAWAEPVRVKHRAGARHRFPARHSSGGRRAVRQQTGITAGGRSPDGHNAAAGAVRQETGITAVAGKRA